MDVAHAEKVEKELAAMIERRSQQKGPDEESDLWHESLERHNTPLGVEAEHAYLAWARHLRGVYAARKEEYERLVETLEATEVRKTA